MCVCVCVHIHPYEYGTHCCDNHVVSMFKLVGFSHVGAQLEAVRGCYQSRVDG